MIDTAPRPGVSVITRSDPTPGGIQSDSGTWFVVGMAQKGPTTAAQLVTSPTQFGYYFGNRISQSILYDAMETFFREGGKRAYIARVVGASAAVAKLTLLDSSSGNSLTISADNPGTWGNGLSVAVTVTNGQYQLTITQSGVVVDQSPLCSTQADAVNWSHNSSWVTVTLPASSPSTLIPAAVSATALTGGADDYAPTDTLRQNALALFTPDLGGGQVSMPGNTTTGNRTALNAHATANARQAILDDTDTSSRSAIVTETSALQAVGNEYSAIFGPWLYVPGLTAGLPPRIVPPCALVAALMARSDASNSVNEPAMADNGRAQWVLDVTQPAWSDIDRDMLNTAGFNTIRVIAGSGVELYGYRTLCNPSLDTTWLALSNQRLREQIIIQAKAIADDFVGRQIDGKGRVVAQFGNQLKAMLMQHFLDGALFGTDPNGTDAFSVDTGADVNTPDTLANNELHAAIGVRMSPFAELVVIEISAVPITQSL